MGLTTTSDDFEICSFCGSSGKFRCGKCGDVWYCSRDHQRQDWNDHSSDCKPYKVKETSEVGRFLVASRDIRAGSVIVRDVPLVVGPLGTSDLICLACHKPIESEDFYKCPDCEWPMCSFTCACSKAHEDECDVLAEDSDKCGAPQTVGPTPRYDLIIIIRSLLLKLRHPKSWAFLKNLASHGIKMKCEGNQYQITSVRYLKEACKMDFDEDIIHHIRGVVLTNALEIAGPCGSRLRAVYPDISFFNHSCRPNVCLSRTDDGIMEARASVDINKGDELNICYTKTDAPLFERQPYLSSAHYFICSCDRCKDPSELGTYFSSPKCIQCPKEIMTPSTIKGLLIWKCKKCGAENSMEEVSQEANEWLFRLEMNDLFGSGTPFKISSALAMIENQFHPTHFIYLKVCQFALWKLAYEESLSALKLKKRLWERVLELNTIFEPGLARKRGMSLYELAKAAYQMVKIGSTEDEFSAYQIKNLLLESLSSFRQAYNILKLEPKGTPEAVLSLNLPTKMEEITREVESLKQ